MIVVARQRVAAAGAKGRGNRKLSLETIGTEQRRMRERELLLTTQTAGRKEQLLQSLYTFVKEGHCVISVGRSQVYL
ncbi:hypothetical protein KKHLCK_14945 [Candidatus Electrothrix laxa]